MAFGNSFDGGITIADGSVTTAKLADDSVTTAKIADANVTAAKLNGAQTGSAPIYGARAWVNFGVDGSNDVLFIRASGNVSSITDNDVGDYTVNFTTAMPDENYAITGSGTTGNPNTNVEFNIGNARSEPTASACRVVTRGSLNLVFEDGYWINVVIFR